MWLCVGISSPLYGLWTWSKCQKTQQVFVVCTQKNFLLEGCGFFVSDIISGGLFSHLSPGRQPLDVSISLKSFYWKLGYNPSLLILWMTFWGFRFKSYDLS